MTKNFIKKSLDDFFQSIGQKLDMKQYEVVELTMKTSVTAQGEWFVHMEATVTNDDPDGEDYKMAKDYDLPQKTRSK